MHAGAHQVAVQVWELVMEGRYPMMDKWIAFLEEVSLPSWALTQCWEHRSLCDAESQPDLAHVTFEAKTQRTSSAT